MRSSTLSIDAQMCAPIRRLESPSCGIAFARMSTSSVRSRMQGSAPTTSSYNVISTHHKGAITSIGKMPEITRDYDSTLARCLRLRRKHQLRR